MTSTDYSLPQLPLGGIAITIVRWLKRAGDAVSAGDPLLVVANDRLEVVLPATSVGILEQVLAAEGVAIAAGARLATIVVSSVPNASDSVGAARATVRISPVAQNIAAIHNVDITNMPGSGVSGRVVKSDVLATLVDLARNAPSMDDRAGHVYADASHPSRIPHPASAIPNSYILTVTEVDLERVATVIAQHGPSFARRQLELSYTTCVALAAVAALPYHPLLNSYWADAMIVARRRVHLAVMRFAGASARCIHDAQDLNLRGLARALDDAATEQSGAARTFVIANLGDQAWGDLADMACGGPDFCWDTAAALGLGAVRARPLVIDDGGVDRLAVRHAAMLTLAYDPRVLDQYYADAFLRDLKRRLEHFHF